MNPLEEKAPRTKRPFQVARSDKESRLSLTGRACTYINLEVRLDLGVFGWISYVRAFTVIQHSTNRTLDINQLTCKKDSQAIAWLSFLIIQITTND